MNMKNLKALRKKNGKTQGDIAEYLGCTVQTIANYENGRRNADYETQLKLAEYFGVSLDYLVRGDSTPRPSVPVGDDEAERQHLIETAKVALFDGGGEVTDAMWEEVLNFAKFVEAREAAKRDENK